MSSGSGAKPIVSTAATTASCTFSTTRQARPPTTRSSPRKTPIDRGLRLQLAVYGAAARQHQNDSDADVLAEYWFVSAQGGFVTKGYHITEAVLAKVGVTLCTIVKGIEMGVFASHPTAISSATRVECNSCDPDKLGVTELRRAWERKRRDGALSPYAELAEPLAGAEIEDECAGVDGRFSDG